MDSELLLVFSIFVSCTGWVIAVLVVVVARTPPRPPAGPKTLELGPEPPAVANFLVHDFTVTADAAAATLIDLAARNVLDIEQRGPEVFYVRMRETRAESLAAYERRVLVALLLMAARDLGTAVEVTGPILRLRTFGGEDEDERYYVAVDDGSSDRIRAWRIDEALYGRLEQGDLITARLSRNLRCVRWIISAEGAAAAG